MEINDPLDLIIYLFFTLLMLFAGLPIGVIWTIGGFRLFRMYGFKDIPENIFGRTISKKPLGVLVLGIFMLISSLWCLFFDRGGSLFNLWNMLTKLVGSHF
ncbi:hypothetical protein [Moritella sp. 28]|uniref:hypothetical protein n=1 Tax=Moritella sp. 28 TaxID=2746232 RepID=UPI001BAD8FA8|nr:hypothetical protein [Moritella sp. 28]QUM86394.1 hypothetical protein HWV02_18720 [Moritella sp. 28]